MSGAYVTIMDTMLMILVICALRFLLRPASARFRCLLWAIVPLRLLCPFVVPSIFSIYQVSDAGPRHPLPLLALSRSLSMQSPHPRAPSPLTSGTSSASAGP